MNSQTSRKLIVASGMAVVVVTGLVIFALRTNSMTPVAQTPRPPAPIAETPTEAPATAAETRAAPAAVAQVPDAPAASTPTDSASAKSANTATASAVAPKSAPSRHLATASSSAVATNDAVTRTKSAADTSQEPAADVVASSELPTTPATGSSPADDQNAGTRMGFAASDSQITTDVKSEIAGDSLSRDVNIGVTTTHGVVALTGSLASQGAIDHFKDVVGKVPGVKSVDTSALVLASL